ncbi:MAG: hypothetical protein ACRC35_04010, partial [Angustibacter sp.]
SHHLGSRSSASPIAGTGTGDHCAAGSASAVLSLRSWLVGAGGGDGLFGGVVGVEEVPEGKVKALRGIREVVTEIALETAHRRHARRYLVPGTPDVGRGSSGVEGAEPTGREFRAIPDHRFSLSPGA